MMRLPYFEYRAPTRLDEAARILAAEGPSAMLLAGGTDLLPNMKRRQQVPRVVVALRDVAGLGEAHDGNGMRLGAGLTLTSIVRDARLRERYPALWQAVSQIATPHLRNMGTLGGNLCLDTRCTYYDQSYEWRRSIDFCMKKDGETCWVAPGSSRCLAVSSTDGAPALIALGARLRLVSDAGERTLPLDRFYRNDGIDYAVRRPDEIVAEVLLDSMDGWKSCYWKLRRRGSFDFPVLSVAAAVRLDRHGVVEEARIVLGAVASAPRTADDAVAVLIGDTLSDESIAAAAERAARLAKPMDNTDFTLQWRKRVAAAYVGYALRELRGDDMRELRKRTAYQSLD